MGSLLYEAVKRLGLHPRALFVMQAANGILAGASVLLIQEGFASQRGLPRSRHDRRFAVRLVVAYVTTSDYDEFLARPQELMLKMLRIHSVPSVSCILSSA